MIFCKIQNGVVVNRAAGSDGSWIPKDQVWIADEAAQIGWAYDGAKFIAPPPPPPPPLTGQDVDAERDRRISLGASVTVNGQTFVADTRNDRDFRNINGLSTAALALISQGSNATITFRDAANVNHTLALADVVSLGLQVAAFTQAIYAKSWALKAMPSVPADYTADKYWT